MFLPLCCSRRGRARAVSAAVTLTLLLSLSLLYGADLKIQRNGNEVVLTWPGAVTNDFYLESTTNLNSPRVWRPAADALAAGTNRAVTNLTSDAARFYRLRTWQVLFDGTSTSKFRGYQQTGFPSGNWSVNANGELAPIVGSAQVDLITTNQFSDFELRWQWKATVGGNSGVNYRATEEYSRAEWSGPEYQLLDDPSFSTQERNKMGAVWSLIAATNKTLLPAGQWNECRIIVQSNHVEHWLNGKRVVSYELNSASFQSAVSTNSNFNIYPNFAKARRGHIALRHENLFVWFRNIKIRELPPE